MNARVVGVTIRCEPKRGALCWGLYVDTHIAGKRVGGTKFFASEAEAEAKYPDAAAYITRLRAEAEEQARLRAVLDVPPLPQAPKGTVLFETMTTRWLEEHVKEMCTAATYRSYKGLLDNHLLPVMRTWPMHDETMTAQRVKDVLKVQLVKKDPPVPLPARLACQACLSAFFSWAIGELPPGVFTVNTALRIGKYVRNKDEKRVVLKPPPNPMTRVQAEAFLKWQQDNYPQLYEWYVWLVDEGSRVGEVSALKDEHLELDRGKAHIVEAFSSSERWQERRDGSDALGLGEKDTKTHRGDQWIDLTPRVVETQRALRTRNLEAWMKRGRRGPQPEHCFLTGDLTPRRPDKIVYRSFREGCDALSLKGQTGTRFTIHCLRDTFATLAILEGKPLGWVSMMLGHADVKTTQKHYIKWIRLVDPNLFEGTASEQK